MKPKQLVDNIWQMVIIDGLANYQDIYVNTPIEDATHPIYQMALKFFSKLDNQQKEDFFSIIKQVEIDTAAIVLAILDGAMAIPGQDGEFSLTLKGKKGNINGDLSDLLLEIAEIDRGD